MRGALAGARRQATTESAAGTAITTVGPVLNASAVPGSPGSGNILAITSGGQISLGGAVLGGSGVVELYYIDSSAYQFNGSNWFGPITASSTGPSPVGSPLPTVLLSGSTIAPNSASGTVIGTLSVTTGLPNGTVGTGAYTWSYAVSGTGASNFQITGSSLKSAVNNLSGGPFNVTITATPTVGIAGGPFTTAATISVTSSGVWPNNPPPQAVAAGFSNLILFDDFLTDNTSQSQSTFTAGKFWYSGQGASQTSPTNYQMLTTTHADSAANNALFTGATSAGANASPNGGVWQIKGISSITQNGNFQTIPQNDIIDSYTGQGTFKHFYLEAYIQYSAAGNSSQGTPAGPSFWTLSPNYTVGSEWDVMEIFGGSSFMGTPHHPAGDGGTGSAPLRTGSQFRTSEWQTLGMLWKSTGTGTGSVSLYINNVLIGTTLTGTGQYMSTMENDVMFILVGTGLGFPVYYDWVKLWQ